jgi:SAM-dependent methyltransferase
MENSDSPAAPNLQDSGDLLRSVYGEKGGVRGVFSSKATDYAASRPDYPAALYDALRDSGALPRVPSLVADLGAGTGLFCEGLLARGHHVFAIEPNAAMRAAADARLHGYAGYQGVDGSAEATTLPDHSVDLVTAAQAFHWFEVEPTQRECLRILRPGGKVALIWNDRILSDPLQREIEAIFSEFGGATREALLTHESRRGSAQFFGGEETTRIDLPHEHELGRDGLRSLVLSRSYMPPRESEAGAQALERVDRVFDAHADSGRVTMRYRTQATVGALG